MRRGERSPARARGFTYLGLLALVVLIGVLLSAAGEVARSAAQREREQELLWVGHQYRLAIGSFIAHNHRYPATLTELLGATGDASADAPPGDSDAPATAPGVLGTPGFRALRRLYRDPMTNSTDWTAVQSPDGHVMGVASTSPRAPIKRAGFDDEDTDFDKAATYADWQFVYRPPASARWRPPAPGATD